MDMIARQKLCYRIIAGFVPAIIFGHSYKLYDPTYKEKYEAILFEEECVELFKQADMLSMKEARDILVSHQLWSSKMDKELELNLEEQRRLGRSIGQLKFKTNERKKNQGLLEKLVRRQEDLERLKSVLDSHTYEYQAKLQRHKKIVFLTTFTAEGSRLWSDWNLFDASISDIFIAAIINAYHAGTNINEGHIRELARSEPWRSMWKAATNVGHLFDKPMVELTDYQQGLLAWSSTYDNIYQHPECPDEEVINNDLLLDQWMIDQQAKRKEGKASGNISNNERINNSSEIGIVVDNDEDAEKVYNLNDEVTKSVLKARQDYVSRKGKVSEDQLPDVQKELKMMATQQNVASVKQRSQ